MPKDKESKTCWVELPPPPKQFNFLKRKRDGTLVAKQLQKAPCWVPSKNASFIALVPEEEEECREKTGTVKSVRKSDNQNKANKANKAKTSETNTKIRLRRTRKFGPDLTMPTTPFTRRRRSRLVDLPPLPPPEPPIHGASILSGLIAALAGPITYEDDACDVAAARCDPCGGSGRDADSEPAFDFGDFLKDLKRSDWEEAVEREKSASVVEAAAVVQAETVVQAEAEAEAKARATEVGTEIETEGDGRPEMQSWEMYMGGDATDGGCGNVAVSLSVLEEIWETSQMDNESRRTDNEERELFLLHALTSELEMGDLLEGFLLEEGQDAEVLELSAGSPSAWESVSAERSEAGSPSIVGVEGEDWTAAVEWQDDLFSPETFSSELGESVGEKGGCDGAKRADKGGTELQFGHSTSEEKLNKTILTPLSPNEFAGTSVSNDRDVDHRLNNIYSNTPELAPEVAGVELPVVTHQVLPTMASSPPLPNPATTPTADPFPIPPAPTLIQIAQIVKNLFALPSPRRRNIPQPQIAWSSPCWRMLALVADGALLDDEVTDTIVGRKHINEAFLLPAPKEFGEEVGAVITADESPGGSVVSLGGESVSGRFVTEEDLWGFDVGAGSVGTSLMGGEG